MKTTKVLDTVAAAEHTHRESAFLLLIKSLKKRGILLHAESVKKLWDAFKNARELRYCVFGTVLSAYELNVGCICVVDISWVSPI